MHERAPVRLLEPLCALIAGVAALALIALPSFGGDAERDAELDDCLARLRTAVWHYASEHGGEADPGFPAQDGNVGTLLAQLTGPSDAEGRIEPDRTRRFGPYLAVVPVNPRNGLATIRIAPADAPANGSAGWIYTPGNGEIRPDLPWSDARGVPLSSY